jgi:hypothetical protein
MPFAERRLAREPVVVALLLRRGARSTLGRARGRFCSAPTGAAGAGRAAVFCLSREVEQSYRPQRGSRACCEQVAAPSEQAAFLLVGGDEHDELGPPRSAGSRIAGWGTRSLFRVESACPGVSAAMARLASAIARSAAAATGAASGGIKALIAITANELQSHDPRLPTRPDNTPFPDSHHAKGNLARRPSTG